MNMQYQVSHQTIEQLILELGSEIVNEVVVVGSAALALAFAAARMPHDIDLSITEAGYQRLRCQVGWTESFFESGGLRLTKGPYDVAVGWRSTKHAELVDRAWSTKHGIRVASLADVYAWKQRRDSVLDRRDTAWLRHYLESPNNPPLPTWLICREIEMVREILPERLLASPLAPKMIQLIANGFANVCIKYGDPRIGEFNQIIGSCELPQYGALAVYHNGFDLLTDFQILLSHLEMIGASPEDCLLALAGDAYSDSVYGGGRKANNSKSYDELRSANLLYAHAIRMKLGRQRAKRLRRIVLGTTFTDATGEQLGINDPDYLVRADCGVDLCNLSEPDEVIATFNLMIENHTSARYSSDRVFAKLFAQLGVRVCTSSQAILLLDKHADELLQTASGEQAVYQIVADFLLHNSHFVRRYVAPYDWTRDRSSIRQAHADKLVELSDLIRTRRLSILQAYQEAHAHAHRLRYS